MDFQECTEFAAENPVCHLATIDGNQPRVRVVMLMLADENGFYFETLSPKDMSKQLHNNSRVEVCFYNNPAELPNAKEMRVTGEIEFVDDAEMKSQVYEKVKFLDDLAGQSVEPFLEIFRISSGDVHFWTMMDVMKESQIEHVTF